VDGNIRTLDFKDIPDSTVMPEDVFEGGVNPFDVDPEEAVDQFPEDGGTLVTGDFTPAPEPLVSVGLHKSQPFFYIEIPSLGIEAPLDVETALSLFDALGAAVNEL
jgi:hypothetical protein